MVDLIWSTEGTTAEPWPDSTSTAGTMQAMAAFGDAIAAFEAACVVYAAEIVRLLRLALLACGAVLAAALDAQPDPAPPIVRALALQLRAWLAEQHTTGPPQG